MLDAIEEELKSTGVSYEKIPASPDGSPETIKVGKASVYMRNSKSVAIRGYVFKDTPSQSSYLRLHRLIQAVKDTLLKDEHCKKTAVFVLSSHHVPELSPRW